MIELIFTVSLVLSLIGLGAILLRRMPDLVKLPESTGDFQKTLISKIKETTKNIPVLKDFSYELYLQKILSKFRVLSMKTENKTGSWLEGLRKRRNGHNHDDGYWEELKKAKDGK